MAMSNVSGLLLIVAVSVLLAQCSASVPPNGAYDTKNVKFLNITSFDGTVLRADVSLPKPKSSAERFPVLVLANSWACPQIEYIIEAQKFAAAGYIVLEYETRGWYSSGGDIDTAGPKDQQDNSEVISWVLKQLSWQPDPANIGLVGVSYGAGIALLGAAHDSRVKTAVSLSGWANLERALFEYSTPNLVWGDVLVITGHILGHPEPQLDEMFKAVLAGNESHFHDFAANRSVVTYKDKLEARKVPIFFSNNLEDRLFHPQDTLDFFTKYAGPKRLLLNQGIHATAEIGGLLDLPHNHVWIEVRKWLDAYLRNMSGPAPPLVDIQLRSNKKIHEEFSTWPSTRIAARTYTITPRGKAGHGQLVVPSEGQAPLEDPPAFETITFGRKTGINAGLPIVGEILQVFVDTRIKSNLAWSNKQHSIWYYKEVTEKTRFCGTPSISLDLTASQSKWQLIVYLFGVDRLTKSGTLISHGSVTCWNCTAGSRQTRTIELRSFCEDLGGFEMGGLGLAFNLYDDLYQPANDASDLSVVLHYSDSMRLSMPLMEDSTATLSSPDLAGEFLV